MSAADETQDEVTANNLIGMFPSETINNVESVLSFIREFTVHVPHDGQLTLDGSSVTGLFLTLGSTIDALRFEERRVAKYEKRIIDDAGRHILS